MNVQTNGIADRIRSSFPIVEKFPLSGPDGMRTNWYGLFRADTGETVGPGSVSSGYEPHTTDDVVALVEAAEAVFGDAQDVKCGFRDGHYVSIQPSHDRDVRLTLYQNDIVFPRLNISGRYGEGFRASIGMFRLICSNLSTMREVDNVSVSFRHTSGLRPKMDELIQNFGLLEHGWSALTARIQQMDEVRVNVAEFLDAMFGQPKERSQRSLTIHRTRTEEIITRLARERSAAGRPMGSLHEASAWEAWNMAQGWAQHDKPRRGHVNAFDRAILASMDPMVHQAEKLLMSMAV